MSEFEVDPTEYGISLKAARVLRQVYVDDQRSMDDAIRLARMRTGETVREKAGRAFIRANGWKRPQSHNAQKSVWRSYDAANYAKTKARARGSGDP